MIDLHSHLLVGIDDGSRSAERSLEVLQRMAADGVQGVVLTPHIKASEIAASADYHVERRERAFRELAAVSGQRSAISDQRSGVSGQRSGVSGQRTAHRSPLTPHLYLGFEIMLDQPLPTLAVGDRRFSLAGSRYYLVEFPFSVVGEFAATVLEQMARSGVVPIVAHPERYDACSPETVRAWRDAGAKVQVDATALTRPTTRGYRARQLVQQGLADVVAADNHGDRRTMLTAAHFLRTHSAGTVGAETVIARLVVENPRAVLEDAKMADVPEVPLREGLLSRLRRFVG